MNKNVVSKYPKWRRRCCECRHMGLNSQEGIFCRIGQAQDGLNFIHKDTKPFDCERFQQWINPIKKGN